MIFSAKCHSYNKKSVKQKSKVFFSVTCSCIVKVQRKHFARNHKLVDSNNQMVGKKIPSCKKYLKKDKTFTV